MRSLPAILLAALTTLVIALSAFVTTSHFGMRDWPTPPMPDTATRLITPTEGAGRAGDDVSDDAPIVLETPVDAGSGEPRRAERPTPRGASREPRATPRGSVRRGERSGRRSNARRESGRRDGERRESPERDDDSVTAPEPDPSTPEPAPAAPASGAGEGAQARPDESASPSTQAPPTLEPIVPDLPPAEDVQSPVTDSGRKRGRGTAGDLLHALP